MECVSLLENKCLKQVGIQLDIRSVIESEEDIQQILKQQNYIHHAHTGNPNMEIIGGNFDNKHRYIASALKKSKYSGYLTAEILNYYGQNETTFLNNVIEVMREYYE